MTSNHIILKSLNKTILPDENAKQLELPEKILQFGTGVLLRGLVDYVIDKANKQGRFNGRVVVVKSTSKGDTNSFHEQNCLFTHSIRGVESGTIIEEDVINGSISRVLSASDEWEQILEVARKPETEIIISNTTEVGIKLDEQDLDHANPRSFPGRLLSVLKSRFNTQGSQSKGFIIIPTELIVDNGKVLKQIVLKLAELQNHASDFISWIDTDNQFCSSLVDRIVPGKPDYNLQSTLEERFQYRDDLMILSESYLLWAIEGDEHVKEILSFAPADKGVVIAGDITVYRELKLRLLNATHTLSSGVACLLGVETVREAMQDEHMAEFIASLMKNEIAHAIPYQLDAGLAASFADQVLDRFRNPYLQHRWINITLQYTSKMKMRVVPVLLKHFEDRATFPAYIAVGFAAFILFMRPVKSIEGNWYGTIGEIDYPIADDHAQYFYDIWSGGDAETVTTTILGNESLWGRDLTQLQGFSQRVSQLVTQISAKGMRAVLAKQ